VTEPNSWTPESHPGQGKADKCQKPRPKGRPRDAPGVANYASAEDRRIRNSDDDRCSPNSIVGMRINSRPMPAQAIACIAISPGTFVCCGARTKLSAACSLGQSLSG